MKVKVYNQEGKELEKISWPNYAKDFNNALVHQVMVAMQANNRTNTAHSKGRSEKRGGGRKPWRQKGTGRARHGSIRSPIWKGGGVTFGPRNERNYKKKINKKMKQLAVQQVLSAKARDKEIYIFDKLDLEKTKLAAGLLNKLKIKSALIVDIKPIAFRNIKRTKTVKEINLLDLLNYKNLVIQKSWLKK